MKVQPKLLWNFNCCSNAILMQTSQNTFLRGTLRIISELYTVLFSALCTVTVPCTYTLVIKVPSFQKKIMTHLLTDPLSQFDYFSPPVSAQLILLFLCFVSSRNQETFYPLGIFHLLISKTIQLKLYHQLFFFILALQGQVLTRQVR